MKYHAEFVITHFIGWERRSCRELLATHASSIRQHLATYSSLIWCESKSLRGKDGLNNRSLHQILEFLGNGMLQPLANRSNPHLLQLNVLDSIADKPVSTMPYTQKEAVDKLTQLSRTLTWQQRQRTSNAVNCVSNGHIYPGSSMTSHIRIARA